MPKVKAFEPGHGYTQHNRWPLGSCLDHHTRFGCHPKWLVQSHGCRCHVVQHHWWCLAILARANSFLGKEQFDQVCWLIWVRVCSFCPRNHHFIGQGISQTTNFLDADNLLLLCVCVSNESWQRIAGKIVSQLHARLVCPVGVWERIHFGFSSLCLFKKYWMVAAVTLNRAAISRMDTPSALSFSTRLPSMLARLRPEPALAPPLMVYHPIHL